MISIIIPFHNEEENLEELVIRISETLKSKEFEIIFIDDGSFDNSVGVIKTLQKNASNIRLLTHRKKFGKGQALKTGIKKAKGEIVVFMDADLQDDPSDLPKFINKIHEGYDLVNGWRKKRRDGLIKTLPSKIGNAIILKHILQSKYHDINCGYKAMKATVLEEIQLYGDNFRFLPIVAEKKGFKTTEVVVDHNPRLHGSSKFGFFRRFTVFADILTAYFIFRFAEKPLHFFGFVGGSLLSVGSIISGYLLVDRIFFGHLLYRRPAFIYGLVFVIVGIQIIMTGIVAELLVYLQKNHANNQ